MKTRGQYLMGRNVTLSLAILFFQTFVSGLVKAQDAHLSGEGASITEPPADEGTVEPEPVDPVEPEDPAPDESSAVDVTPTPIVAAVDSVPAVLDAPAPSSEQTQANLPLIRSCGTTTCRRLAPDYDGRLESPAAADDALLWIPRVIFFPVHLLLEYGIRQPLGLLLTTAERERWEALAIDLFSSESRNEGLVPTAFYDFGFRPSVGAHFWWNEGLFRGHRFRLTAGFGGVDLWHGHLVERIEFSDQVHLSFEAEGITRPDQMFFGIGANTSQSRAARYWLDEVGGKVTLRVRPWRASEVVLFGGAMHRDFRDGTYQQNGGDRSFSQALAEGLVTRPEGYERYVPLRASLRMALDSRPSENLSPLNTDLHFRVEAQGEVGTDANLADRSWARGELGAGVFVELPHDRSISLSAGASLAEPLGGRDVPFLELVQLGGNRIAMEAFSQGRLMGRSGVTSTLEYRYSIWPAVDGSLHVSVGNVFGRMLSDFDVARLRLSIGFGIRTRSNPDNPLVLAFAVGTDTFEQGTGIAVYRFIVGTQPGF